MDSGNAELLNCVGNNGTRDHIWLTMRLRIEPQCKLFQKVCFGKLLNGTRFSPILFEMTSHQFLLQSLLKYIRALSMNSFIRSRQIIIGVFMEVFLTQFSKKCHTTYPYAGQIYTNLTLLAVCLEIIFHVFDCIRYL